MALPSKVLPVLIASILTRVPNFVLPIAATRLLAFSEYSIFAVAFVTASAISAFLGEAIAATISRESYRVRAGAHGSASLAVFFKVVVLVSYLTITLGVGIYWFFIASPESEGWLLAVGTVMLVPAYILPAATTALAAASSQGATSVVASVIGIPMSIVLSLFFGATYGVAYFFVVYFVCVIFTNLYVYIKISAESVCSLRGACNTLREYVPVFMGILVPFLMGGPVHGFCMSVIGRQEYGVTELAKFVAYYPWSLVVSVFAGFLATNVIQLVVELRRENDVQKLKRFMIGLLFSNMLVAVLVGVSLWLGKNFVFSLYDPEFEKNLALFAWMLICGVSAACLTTTSQIMIGSGNGKGLLMCAIFHAVLYGMLTIYFVEQLAQGGIGLVRALTISQFTIALAHMGLIYSFVKRGSEKNGSANENQQ